ncbi:MAG: biotin transporter BioY [Euryarchaeota archaeon]|nr:biotin transporter BioY [Euryarchaeota archaeon]
MEFIDSYRNATYNYFRWRTEAEFVQKVSLALAFAGLTGLAAQARLYLPFTPVPVTGQVFAVLFSAIALGRFWGGFSQVLYVAIGAMWVPWFAPKEGAPIFSKGGFEVITGATGGYIIGFVLAAFLIGWLVDSYIAARRVRYLVPIFLAGVAIIYACGALWLAHVLGVGMERAIALGVLPFVAVDIMKAVLAAVLASAVLPKERFGTEN